MTDLHDEFSIDIDETRANSGGPAINLFNVDMKYQSIDFTTIENPSIEQDENTKGDNITSNRSVTPPAPSLDIFDFGMKYTEDEEQFEVPDNVDVVVSPAPQLRGIDFTSFSKREETKSTSQSETNSVSQNEGKVMVQNSVEETATSQNAQKSVLMQSVLQKIKTTQTSGDSQVVQVEKNVTEVKVTHTEKRLQETTSTFIIENSVKMKNNGDSDEEFDFDTPTTKTSDMSKNSDGQKLKETTQASMTAKSKAVPETFPPFANAEKQPPMMPVTKDPELKAGPAVGVVQKAPTSTSEGLTQGLPEKGVGVKFIGQAQTVSEIGDAVLKQVCENGTVSKSAHVQNTVEDEWDKVQTIEAGFVDENDPKKKENVVTNVPLLSYYEMSEHLGTQDFSGVKDKIRTTVEYHGFSKLKHFLFGPPKLHRDLHEERDRIFCIAASVLDNSDQIHVRSLQTIYRSLTGSRFDCPRYGNHWKEIGFQGRDPATDLRGVGLLGLVHLVYLLRDAKRQVLASEIYKLSLHPTQNFPFCVMSINLTRIALQALREGCLNKECNKQREVLPLMCDFYTGLYLQMYQVWKSQGKTITDSGFVLQHIETHGKKHPHAVLKNLEEYLAKKKSAANLENVNLGEEQFMSVVDSETAGHY